ncbi:uncharacterized protein LOC128490341 [Spea bombifrons]|uniref:uncharacterized protein LOC128490341 n=1 Tax=Spea bombifrons TaxID=233779 RepID=UPI00234B5903|nr:uncharacterized protein LOC128490341 [Spea bombifrons]
MYGNIDYPPPEGSPKLPMKKRKPSEESNIYLQDDSIYEPVGNSREQPKLPWKEVVKKGRCSRKKVLFVILSIGVVLLILILCAMGLGVAKYFRMAAEMVCLKKEQQAAASMGSFLIYNEAHGKCAEVHSFPQFHLGITANICSPLSRSQLFHWFPGSRLFNLREGLCLGVSGTPQARMAVRLFPCDSAQALSWVCTNSTLLGVKGHQLYFNYGNNPQGILMLYGGTGTWSRWKSRGIDGALQEGGACIQTCEEP